MSTTDLHDEAHVEAPLTLEEPAPRTLGLADQLGLWGNLGVSLTGFTGAVAVLAPTGSPLTLGAALLALLIGSLVGAAAIAVASVPGAETGAPAMVLLRGIFGAKLSWLPTGLNIVQLVGWSTFELVTIATALHQVSSDVPRWVFVVACGALTTMLALRPLGWIRVLRRYVTVAVLVALAYLAIQLLREPLPGLGDDGSWTGFLVAVDIVIGVAISWVPLASDYSRYSRSVRSAAVGAFAGFSVSQFACYTIGLLALVTVAGGDSSQVFAAFVAIPLGGLVLWVIAARELDVSFADTFSTAVSIQNLRPRWDRRVVALAVGTLATLLALTLTIEDFASFLLAIGSVFVPLFGVLVVDYWVVSRKAWDLSETAPARPWMLLPWAAGFAVYQVVNPGSLGWWTDAWTQVAEWVHFTPQDWTSASLLAFLTAAVLTLPVGALTRRPDAAAQPPTSVPTP